MRKSAPRLLLALLLLPCLAGVARAQGAELISGQKAATTLEDGWLPDVYRFQAVEGDLLKLTIVASKKTGLEPAATLVGPGGAIALPEAEKGRIKAKKVPLGASGTYFLSVLGGGTTGDYKLALKLKGAKVVPVTVAVPGVVEFDAPRNALLTVVVKAEKGSGLEPGVDSITDATGADVLEPEALKEKGAAAKVKKLLCPVFGRHSVALVVRGGQPGNATVKLKLKPAKPVLRKLGTEHLPDVGILKGVTESDIGIDVFAFGVSGATLVFPPETGLEDVALDKWDDDEYRLIAAYASVDDLDAAWPDGLYSLRVTLLGGEVVGFPVHVGGEFPTLVTAIDVGAFPSVSWTGGDGASYLYFTVYDPLEDEEVYAALLPAGATSHSVPADLVPDGVPFTVEVVALGSGAKLTAGEAGGGGGAVTYNAALDVGDLLTFTLDLATRRYTYEFLEGVNQGQTGAGELTPVEGVGRFVFTAKDDGSADETPIVLLPGNLLLGGDEEGGLFAGVPALSSDYTTAEIQGRYNFVRYTCSEIGEDLLCDSDFGTFEIADGTWSAWGGDGSGPADETGTWTDQGNGILHVFAGPDRFANVMVLPGPTGGKMMIIDILAGGIMLGVRQESVSPGDFQTTYDAIATDEEGVLVYKLEGRELTTDDDAPVTLDFDSPWTGLVKGGDDDEGGIGLPSPLGVIFIGGWYPDEEPPNARISYIAAGIAR